MEELNESSAVSYIDQLRYLLPYFKRQIHKELVLFLCQQLNEKYTEEHIFLAVNYFLNKKNALWETVGVTALTETGFWKEYR